MAHKKYSILIVDDDKSVAHLMHTLVRGLGHEAHCVYDGSEAISAFRTRKPKVILLDIGLPTMDGYEVARTIRNQNHEDPVIIVAVTGYGRRVEKIKSEEAGFNYHLTKPVSIEALRHIIDPPDEEF
ncbi:MAG: response regulator [Patescibacteria group bacterium]